MVLNVMRKLTAIVKATVIILAILLLAPRLVSAAMQMSCEGMSLETEIVSQTEVSSNITARVQALAEYECMCYNGSVFVDTEFPNRFLGFHVGDIRIFRDVPGTVTAGIDLSGFTENDILHQMGVLRVELPGISLLACELDMENIAGGVYPDHLPIDSADDIALVQDALLSQARTELIAQAVECGLLDRAEEELRSQVVELARTIGYTGDIEIVFRNSDS